MATEQEHAVPIKKRSGNLIEQALIALIVLFMLGVFVALIIATITSVDTANQFLPTAIPTTTK
jgi:hypothetical protein